MAVPQLFFTGADKVHVEFGIVALAHNILKTAGIRQLLSEKNRKHTKASGKRRPIFLHLLHFKELWGIPTNELFQIFPFFGTYV